MIDNVQKRLGTDEQYRGLIYSHETSSIHQGPKICLYKTLPTMKDKVDEQIKRQRGYVPWTRRGWWKEF
jgi:DNA polymerase II large subunit